MFGFGKGKPCLFIIDDDTILSETVVEILSSRINSKYLVFENIESALAKLDKVKVAPYAILSDVSMPGGSGFKLEKELENRNLKIPVIYITGLQGSLPDNENLTILSKPVDFDKLEKLLRVYSEEI